MEGYLAAGGPVGVRVRGRHSVPGRAAYPVTIKSRQHRRVLGDGDRHEVHGKVGGIGILGSNANGVGVACVHDGSLGLRLVDYLRKW